MRKIDIMTSPYYPKLYPNKTECNWFISVSHNKRVELVFVVLDTEDNHDTVSVSFTDKRFL